jgi:hypothetical protein
MMPTSISGDWEREYLGEELPVHFLSHAYSLPVTCVFTSCHMFVHFSHYILTQGV